MNVYAYEFWLGSNHQLIFSKIKGRKLEFEKALISLGRDYFIVCLSEGYWLMCI